jgi:phosphotransferase system HPr (HPr) family protein
VLRSSDPTASIVVALPPTVDLHARPAGLVVREASRFSSAIVIAANGKQASAKSILELLGLGATGGTELAISADGVDAADALAGLGELIPSLS